MATVDTLKYYEQLRKAGNDESAAKAQVYIMWDQMHNLVDKEKLSDVEKSIDKQLDITQKLVIAALILLLKVAIWG